MIYFITAREIGRVKIGFSEEPRSRFMKMRTDSPIQLALERICDGTVHDERELHTRFAQHRSAGEWFNLAPEIEAFMGTLPLYKSARREKSLAQLLVAATGMSKSYATQVLSPKYPHQITIPIAISVFRFCGRRVGPIEDATDDEIAVLEKFCGTYVPTRGQEAA